MNHHRAPSSMRETGFVLVTSLVFLVVLTLLAVGSEWLRDRVVTAATGGDASGVQPAEAAKSSPLFSCIAMRGNPHPN